MYVKNPNPVVVSTVHLDVALHSTLKDVCTQHGWSLRWFTQQALREKLARMAAAGA
jgi:hypothetical protein